MTTKIAQAFVLAFVLCACAADKPISNAPTATNPCGVDGVDCLDMAGNLSGMCCTQAETCGGGKYSVGCPVGECCDIDDSQGGGYGAKRTKQPKLQWKAGPR